MSPETLALIERRVTRLRDEHVNQLLSASIEALDIIQVQRKATISDGMELLLLRTSEALSGYIANVKQDVIGVINSTNSTFGAQDKTAVLTATMKYFPDAIYTERFSIFLESIVRHFSRAGMNIDLLAYRPDIFVARLSAGCSTVISRFGSSFADDLEIVIHRQKAAPT